MSVNEDLKVQFEEKLKLFHNIRACKDFTSAGVKDGVEVKLPIVPGCDDVVVRCDGDSRGTLDDFYEIFRDFLEYSKLDELRDPVKSHEVERYNDHFALFYNYTNLPSPISKRDFIFFHAVEHITDIDGEPAVLCLSWSHPEGEKLVPPVSGCVRGFITVTGFLVKQDKQDPELLHITYVAQADMKGWIPKWVIKSSAIVQSGAITAMQKMMDKRRAKA